MKLTVGTFNLFQFAAPPYAYYTRKGRFQPKAWQEKVAWISTQIEAMRCDIIGFQELFSQAVLQKILKELGFHYFVCVDTPKVSPHDAKRYVTTTVALASKYPISKVETIALSTTMAQAYQLEEPLSFSRLPIKATITLPKGEELLLYVCHLKSNRRNAYEPIFQETHTLEEKRMATERLFREASAKALRQRVVEAASLFAHIQQNLHTPTILLGDLNDKEFSLTIEALTNPLFHHTQATDESPILYDAHYLYTPQKPRLPTSYFLNRGIVLDYIFLSKAFLPHTSETKGEVTHFQLHNQHLQRDKNGSLLTSDHAQVVCELTLSF
jgi:endonuclease/exonuclease/phosphatase family metal-dependent hydrolase